MSAQGMIRKSPAGSSFLTDLMKSHCPHKAVFSCKVSWVLSAHLVPLTIQHALPALLPPWVPLKALSLRAGHGASLVPWQAMNSQQLGCATYCGFIELPAEMTHFRILSICSPALCPHASKRRSFQRGYSLFPQQCSIRPIMT